jgi:hypothetical protein
MNLSIHSTSTFTELEGKRCRLWEGKTDAGTRLWVFVALISVSAADDTAELDQELTQLLLEEAQLRAYYELHKNDTGN